MVGDCSSNVQMQSLQGLQNLPTHVLSTIFTNLSEDDLRSLRLVSREFCAAANTAVRSLRPLKCDDIIPRFPSLETIDLSGVEADAWSESSLACLNHASNLTALRLGQHSRITSSGASIIASLIGLQALEIVDTGVPDTALAPWSALSNLTSLSLLGCRNLTSKGLSYMVGSLKQLQVVELSACPGVDDSVLEALGMLPLLRKVNLSSCDSFTETGISALGAAPALRALLLPGCCHIDDAIIDALCHAMPDLECLSLFEAGEFVSDDGLTRLASLTALTGLDLGYSCWAHTSTGLDTVLRALPRLQMLNVGGTEGGCDSVLRTLGENLTALTRLDISECQRMSATGVQCLANLSSLKDLTMGWNLRLTDTALRYLPPGVTKLDLSYSHELTLATLAPGSLPKLASCQVRRCTRMTDTGVAALAAAAPALRHLDLSHNVNVSSGGLRCLSTLTNLSSLRLSGCPKAATVLGLGSLAHVPSLTTLDACNNPRLDNGCMQAVSFVRQLKHVSLRGCHRVSDHGVMALGRIARLESLEIDGRNVRPETVEKLQRRLPRLRKVKMSCKDPMKRIIDWYDNLAGGSTVAYHGYGYAGGVV